MLCFLHTQMCSLSLSNPSMSFVMPYVLNYTDCSTHKCLLIIFNFFKKLSPSTCNLRKKMSKQALFCQVTCHFLHLPCYAPLIPHLLSEITNYFVNVFSCRRFSRTFVIRMLFQLKIVHCGFTSRICFNSYFVFIIGLYAICFIWKMNCHTESDQIKALRCLILSSTL